MCLSNSSPKTSEFAFSAKVGFEIARIRDLKARKLAISFLGFPLRTNSDSPAASGGDAVAGPRMVCCAVNAQRNHEEVRPWDID